MFIEHSECRICRALRVENASLLPVASKRPLRERIGHVLECHIHPEVVLSGDGKANDPMLDVTAV